MFKKIIAYVGICLCFVLCFGMFFVKPVNAQVISEGSNVVSQFFPTRIDAPMETSGFNYNISIPIEKVKSSLQTDINYLGNTIAFSHENIPDINGTISYDSLNSHLVDTEFAVLGYYTPFVIDSSSSSYANEYHFTYENLVVPIINNVGVLPFSSTYAYEFSILLNRNGFFTIVDDVPTNVILSVEDFVCENFQFDIVYRDTSGSIGVKTHYINDLDSSCYSSDSTSTIYYLGEIINREIYDAIDLENFVFGYDYVYLANFKYTLRLYANSYDSVFTNYNLQTYPIFNMTIPLIVDNGDFDDYNITSFLTPSNGFSYIQQEIEPIDSASWLITSVGAFMNAELFPGFAIGGIFAVMVAFPLVIWFLKIVLGG